MIVAATPEDNYNLDLVRAKLLEIPGGRIECAICHHVFLASYGDTCKLSEITKHIERHKVEQ